MRPPIDIMMTAGRMYIQYLLRVRVRVRVRVRAKATVMEIHTGQGGLGGAGLG